MRVGSAETDEIGRFIMHLAVNHVAIPLSFRWKRRNKSGRTPRLDPWLPGAALRIACYEASPLKPAARWSASLRGRIRTRPGAPAAHLRVQLVEQSSRFCRRISVTKSGPGGAYEVGYDPDRLLAPDDPDLRIIVFDANDVPLKESREMDFSLPDEQVRTASLDDAAFREAAQLVQDESRVGRVRPEDVEYLTEKRGMNSRAAALRPTGRTGCRRLQPT
ncbi:MAG: hypothetical protein GY769_02640 [bacterium]|nr:hypothetical protein [bacterium]